MRVAICAPTHELFIRPRKLARSYARAGCRVIVVGNTRGMTPRHCADVDEEHYVGLAYPYRSRWVPLGNAAYNVALYRRLQAIRPDVIVAGDLEGIVGAAAYKKFHARGCRLIYDIADNYAARYRVGRTVRSAIQWVDDLLMSQCDEVLLPQANRYANFQWRRPRRYRIVPNCPFLEDAPPPSAIAAAQPVRILMSGLFTWRRGVRQLVEAAERSGVAQVVAVPADCGLLDPSMEDFMRRSQVVEFHAPMAQKELLQLAQTCHLVAAMYEPSCPIHVQAAPNKVFDAMAAARPCLLNAELDIAGEVVHQWQCGVAVPYHDVDALARLLVEFSQDPDLGNRLGENGRRLFEREYHWERVTQDIRAWGSKNGSPGPSPSSTAARSNTALRFSNWCPKPLRPFWDRIAASEIGARLARGAFWSVAGTMASRGLIVLSFVPVARLLGPERFGELGIIRSTVGMFGIFAGFGLGITSTKYIADFRRGDPERAGSVMALSELLGWFTSVLMGLLLWILAPWLATSTLSAPQLAGALRAASLLLVFQSLIGVQSGALIGFEAFYAIARMEFWGGMLSFPLVIVGTLWAGVSGAIAGLTAALGAQWFLGMLALRREARAAGVAYRWRRCLREGGILWRFSVPALLSGAMVSPANWISKALLARQPGGYMDLAVFEVADQWRLLVLYVPTLVIRSCLPVLSQLFSEGRVRQFRHALRLQYLANGALTVALVGGTIVLTRPIMVSYGSFYAGHATVFVLMMVGALFAQLAQVGGLVNQSMGVAWWSALLNLLWACILVAATYALVQFRSLGLAWAVLISYICHLAFTSLCVGLVLARRTAIPREQP